ncbi:hypothetical protein [Niveibacterium sp. SC-1]|uniref:hypothetical protein n=1 Tax=Niveibacterium sp. SC-1 TaxID=3135646 RepID=UPI00311D5E42
MSFPRHAVALFASLLLLCVGACASVSVKDAWSDPAFASVRYRKILVLGISANDTNRRVFEDSFARALQTAGVQAVPAYTLIPEGGQVPGARITEAVQQSGADAVMVTRLQRVEQKTEVTPGMAMPPAYGVGFYRFYGGAWASTPPTVSQYDVLTLESTLWDAAQQKAAWSAVSEAVDPQQVSKLTDELAKALIEKLKADGKI